MAIEKDETTKIRGQLVVDWIFTIFYFFVVGFIVVVFSINSIVFWVSIGVSLFLLFKSVKDLDKTEKKLKST